jgi:hypothetical protein
VGWTLDQAAVRRRIEYASRASGQANPQVAGLEKQWEILRGQWATRFDAVGAPVPVVDTEVSACDPADVFTTTTATPADTTRHSSTTRAAFLPVEGPFVRWGDVALRLLASVLLLVAVAAAYFWNRRRPMGNPLLSYPRLVGVLAGLAWWLWLTPSVIGWLIVAASLIPSVRRLPGVRPEPDTTRTGTLPVPNRSRR